MFSKHHGVLSQPQARAVRHSTPVSLQGPLLEKEAGNREGSRERVARGLRGGGRDLALGGWPKEVWLEKSKLGKRQWRDGVSLVPLGKRTSECWWEGPLVLGCGLDFASVGLHWSRFPICSLPWLSGIRSLWKTF